MTHQVKMESTCQNEEKWTEFEIYKNALAFRETFKIRFNKQNTSIQVNHKTSLDVWVWLWRCAKKSNIKITQTFLNKVLRGIVGSQWYGRNNNIHRDLKIETIDEAISLLQWSTNSDFTNVWIPLCRRCSESRDSRGQSLWT